VLTVLNSFSPVPTGVVGRPIQRVHGESLLVQTDALAVEEPLEIRLGCDGGGRRLHRALSVTMRTPGHDLELAAGFLLTEGIIGSVEQIDEIEPEGRPGGNVVRVELKRRVPVDLDRLERHFYTSSSCGVCGKTSIAAVQVGQRYPLPADRPLLEASVIHRLPGALRAA
jgi:FdhD protein